LHLGQHLAGGGVDAVEGLSTAGGDVLATDVELLFGETGHGLSSVFDLLREQPILFKLNDQSTKTTERTQSRHSQTVIGQRSERVGRALAHQNHAHEALPSANL
jgi:hypothetical protein